MIPGVVGVAFTPLFLLLLFSMKAFDTKGPGFPRGGFQKLVSEKPCVQSLFRSFFFSQPLLTLILVFQDFGLVLVWSASLCLSLELWLVVVWLVERSSYHLSTVNFNSCVLEKKNSWYYSMTSEERLGLIPQRRELTSHSPTLPRIHTVSPVIKVWYSLPLATPRGGNCTRCLILVP